jgi:hypothetical protein
MEKLREGKNKGSKMIRGPRDGCHPLLQRQYMGGGKILNYP